MHVIQGFTLYDSPVYANNSEANNDVFPCAVGHLVVGQVRKLGRQLSNSPPGLPPVL